MYNLQEPMLRTGKIRTWTVVAALTMAVLYGSFCSTACAVAALPMGTAPSHCDKCDHQRPSVPSHHNQTPSDQNCGRHVHPTYFVQASGAPHPDFGTATSLHAPSPIVVSVTVARLNSAASRASGLAPPGRSEALLPENFSILRI